jgi:7-cyano-7-deazaguanine synthase
MCSIAGGTRFDQLAEYIWKRCADRGRDDAGYVVSENGSWIGNRRATPTTEVEAPIERQPVQSETHHFVFNGIISNDHELGIAEGEADTSVLARVLDPSTLKLLRDSLHGKIVGSYALATLNKHSGEIFLATNYKPIWVCEYDGHWYFSSLRQHFPPAVRPFRVEPYTVTVLGDLVNIRNNVIPREQSDHALVIASGGLDSTTAASVAIEERPVGGKVKLLHFNYGCQATIKEIESVQALADYFGCDVDIITMSSFGGSALLESDAEIAQGIAGAEYAHEWVPARNLMMLSHAVAYAEARNFGHIYLGTNLEEAGAYPDNEEQFILDFNNLLYGAVQNGVKIEIHTPLGGLMKHEIIPLGRRLGTPYHLTWSCYKDGEEHCGECGPCYMRRTAFERNNLQDPVFE